MDKEIFKNFSDSDFTWAEKEFISAELGDKRLKQRLVSITQAFLQHPAATIPQAMGDWAGSKAAYRFFENSKVSFAKIIESHKEATRDRLTESSVVLAIQDTSFVDYSSHPSTKGLGFLADENHRGLMIHPTLLVSPQGVPLGLIDLQILMRDQIGVKEQRKFKTIEEKESHKWLESYRATAAFGLRHPDKQMVNVADREGDIYEFFHEALDHKSREVHAPDVLVRAAWNRKVKSEQKTIWPYMESKNIAGTVDMEVPRTEDQPSRKTTLNVRYAQITLSPPQRPRGGQKLQPITLWAVYVHEQQPPDALEPISWMLLTTVAVTDFSKALAVLRWYICRWLIEIYFKILKSGCQIEERQLEAAHRLKNCLAVDCIVAWRIFFITMIGRSHPDIPVSIILEESEWKALYSFVQKKPYTSDLIPSLGDAIVQIGKLGGFLNRKGDQHPGVICIWRGMWRLADISATWKVEVLPSVKTRNRQS
jgi:hypothetical protein